MAKKKAGRPKGPDSKTHVYQIRLDSADEAAALADIQRLYALTGQEWNMSSYARMCMRAMHGKHLA